MRKEMLEFWNQKDLYEAKKRIVCPETWESDTSKHCQLILNGLGELPFMKSIRNGEKYEISALDIGCGIGRMVKAMSSCFDHVYGVDISEDMLNHGAEYLKDVSNCSTHLIRQDNKFDESIKNLGFVYSIVVFQHIPSIAIIRAYLNQCFERMLPGAVIRIQTHRGIPNPDGVFCGYAGHMFRSVASFAEEFERAGFNVLTTQDGLGHVEWLWVTAVKPS